MSMVIPPGAVGAAGADVGGVGGAPLVVVGGGRRVMRAAVGKASVPAAAPSE
jgi:hypothetical protein